MIKKSRCDGERKRAIPLEKADVDNGLRLTRFPHHEGDETAGPEQPERRRAGRRSEERDADRNRTSLRQGPAKQPVGCRLQWIAVRMACTSQDPLRPWRCAEAGE